IKQRYPEAKTVFIGPCVAKKDEANHYEGIVDAVLTFEELTRMLEEKKIALTEHLDVIPQSRARLFPTTGGILKTMKRDQEQYTYLAIDGLENCIAALDEIEKGSIENCFIEMSACAGSCVNGPVMEKYHHMPISDYTQVASYAGKEDFEVHPIDAKEMIKQFEFIDRKLGLPTESELVAILRQMGKMKPSQELNCGSCGYNTCREKAVAIYQGKADLTMCLPFLKDKAESFSTNIVDNTPDGIIVLNENLEVQQINKAACSIMNLQSSRDILGEPVIRVLDPTEFMNVKLTGKTIHDKRMYLVEYGKYVDETIVYDR
ncbi:MAG: [Fe-Fe] hydrogenase large subunit C-terminal domain-containing protein, partial [Oscillospiraceae bacterium]